MQLSHIPVMGEIAASGFRLSCSQLTPPSVTHTVIAAKVAPAEVPKRISLPSRLPRCWSTGRPATAGQSTVFLPPGEALSGTVIDAPAGCAVIPGLGFSVSK